LISARKAFSETLISVRRAFRSRETAKLYTFVGECDRSPRFRNDWTWPMDGSRLKPVFEALEAMASKSIAKSTS